MVSIESGSMYLLCGLFAHEVDLFLVTGYLEDELPVLLKEDNSDFDGYLAYLKSR